MSLLVIKIKKEDAYYPHLLYNLVQALLEVKAK